MVRSEPGSAFTLLELLVVIAIIGLLAALLLPSPQSGWCQPTNGWPTRLQDLNASEQPILTDVLMQEGDAPDAATAYGGHCTADGKSWPRPCPLLPTNWAPQPSRGQAAS